MVDAIHITTPLIDSVPLSRCAGRRVWLKLENCQPSGSFKARGIGYACRHHRDRGCSRFVASSGGNAGLAVAYAGRRLRVPVTVVVPETTSPRARDLIVDFDAELVVHGASWQEAHAHALSLVQDDVAYIHPFDDPLIWEGHATVVDEIVERLPAPGAIVLSVGGGGLLSGVATGLLRVGLPELPIVCAETAGADSFHQATLAGRLVALSEISSVATSLGAKQIAARALEVSRQMTTISALVSDAEAVDACIRFADDHRAIVEPACGASLALAYQNSSALPATDDLVIIVCGGAGITYEGLVNLQRNVG